MSEGSVISNMQVDSNSSYADFGNTERCDGADAGISTDTRSPDDPNLSTPQSFSRGSIHAETSADLVMRLDIEAISSVRSDAFLGIKFARRWSIHLPTLIVAFSAFTD